MICLLRIAFLIAIALGVVAASVLGAKDSRILAAPPENELSGFLTRLTLGRFDPAAAMLSEKLRRRVTSDSLRELHRTILDRAGRITKREAERRWIRNDRALAGGSLTGERRDVAFDVPMIRERGVWKVADVAPIAAAFSAP